MAALDLPFLWIEVVGTVSDVLFPSQRYLAVRNQHIALRGFCREIDSLLAQVADGIFVRQFYLRKNLFVEHHGEGETLVGNDVFPLARSQFDAGMYYLQIPGCLLIDGFPSAWDGIEVVLYGYRFIVG